jgi:hypothetical protein
MKKFLLSFAIVMAGFTAFSQLNNSWIDYSKTYYKFPLAKDTVCRISQATLAASGLNSVDAAHFQLWRNGKQVRLFTSIPSGVFGANDYIEFWGEMNDGKPDKDLYRDANYQFTEKYSLSTDTAIYYLTVNTTASQNLRYTLSPNIVTGNTLPADAYFMRKIESFYKNSINQGYAAVIGEYVYSSSYDIGEAWMSNGAGSGGVIAKDFTGMNRYAAGPPNSVTFTVGAVGNGLIARDVICQFYSTIIYQTPMPFFNMVKDTVRNIPLSLLASATNLPVRIGHNGINDNGGIKVSNFSVTYPATFNFNNEKSFYFELEPNANGNYIKISNFSHGGLQPILYDYTNGRRYLGDITTIDTVKFVLPPSSVIRKFNLVSQDNSNVNLITSLTSKTFINYGAAANQGDYIIISHPVLYNDGSGVNNVDLYKQYRSSAAGGSYNAKIYDINELTEQFAFGIKKHPAAIRDFVRYANQQYTIKPKYVFLIGRGMGYIDYTQIQSDPVANQLNLVQSFGWPASDILLVSEPGSLAPLTAVGRLGAVNGTEVGIYLNKVKEFEQAQNSTTQTLAVKGWMKDVLLASGPADSSERQEFAGYLNTYGSMLKDTLFGGYPTLVEKSSVAAIEQQQSALIERLMNNGLGYVKYFGHSSANDLAINLNFPENYTNQGKYPFFHVSGCTVGNFYGYRPLRPTGYSAMSLSEKYIFIPNKGSIGFLGSTHWGIAPFLNFYNQTAVNKIAKTEYGKSIGDIIKSTVTQLGSNPSLDYYTRVHLEEVNLHGDPAISINKFAKPDYVIEESLVKFNPNIITVADNSFTIDVKMRNIGRAIGDSIRVTLKHQLPNDSINILYDKVIPSIKYIDSVFITVPMNPITYKGLNKLIITLDDGNRISELSETNNTLIREFYIFEDELRPTYPYNYAIVNQQNISYQASTANPLLSTRQYVMEIDTTENFNSAFKKTYNQSGVGGAIEFKPTNLTFTDSTVYYWRVAVVPLNNANYIWNTSSFVYLANGGTGFNQSHYFQYKKNSYQDIVLDNDRIFKFTPKEELFNVRTTFFGASNQIPDFALLKGATRVQAGFYSPFGTAETEAIRFYVLDKTTLAPFKNIDNGTTGLYNSIRPIPLGNSVPGFFNFKVTTLQERQNVMTFLDDIQAGNTVILTNCASQVFTNFPQSWRADTLTLGSGNSLYHKLKNMGWSSIDSITFIRPFIFVTKKGANVPTVQVQGATNLDKLSIQLPVIGSNLGGEYTSDKFGPAKEWQELHWRGRSIENVNTDNLKVEVIGVNNLGVSTTLATIKPSQDTSLSWINANTYPYLKLKMTALDSVNGTPDQLRYWRVNAKLFPEGAVAPNILYSMRDTVEQGEKIDFKLAFKNVSQLPFDSTMKFNFIITDRNNQPHVINIPRGKLLIAGDTLTIKYQIDSKDYPGANTLFVDVNPNNHQAEQFHFNNVLYKDFYVKPDNYNPMLDVTFDGVHILNKDIVAAKPHIVVNLKDESRFMALADTALLKVQIRFPDGSLKNYFFGDVMQFTPANLGTGKNTATIDLKPIFTEDGEYELIVSGRDVVGNKAGELEYKVAFTVISKAMISNLLNYPNPFTTSTAFVFTVTGNEVPQNIRIQILTITGKIVREITKNELGPIHVGRNITEYKWDGTDTYGQKLANGVYLYRVLTNLNGKSLEKYKAEGDETDKYFNKGYGKMVIIR